MKILIDSAIPYIKGVFEPYAEVVYLDGKAFKAQDVASADALIIRTRTRCDESLLKNSQVKIISTATIGFDHIDLDYCASHGIQVTTAQGCNAAGVLQWVAASLVHLSRKQGWKPQGQTLGIVGVGHVGKLIEKYARMWGFNVLRCDPPRKQREGGDFITLEELLPASDIVTLHTPLDATTFHMINPKTISLMKPHATLINASRGEVAQSQALLNASQTLALDVWEGEPDINRLVLEKSTISTPHIAGYSAQGKANASKAVVEAVSSYFKLPIADWYPPQVEPTVRKDITWEELCQTIDKFCDIERESEWLRSSADDFESLRNNYDYRQEYF
ncbi:MAG: 4-phosphoerythronate dehydrogenase [Alistipes sp.]|jgi:erythronate-4-phosphate dehydrogenase|nr:4-phosphoerythronate dehydrogenase [Alistipes sp.]